MLIAVTPGDACGVGPEILLRTFREGELRHPFVVYGDACALRFAAARLGLAVELQLVQGPEEALPGRLNVIDLGLLCESDITPGVISKACGAAGVQCVELATRHALAGRVDAIATLPLNKEASRLTYPDFQGHTELIAGLCGAREIALSLVAPALIVSHVSTHVALREAIERVRGERILTVLRLTHAMAHRLGRAARIGVAGLNPHAGEGGAFGREEIDVIAPALAAARAEGLQVTGPLPPDTMFMQAAAGKFDAIVCMYHDQGHIPMKLQSFEETVNVTLGLPIVRASVDHGTAFDIAYRGVASTRNFIVTFELAAVLAASAHTSPARC